MVPPRLYSRDYTVAVAVFAGIDLSWTGLYDSGLCIVEETDARLKVIDVSARVVSTGELCGLLTGHATPVIAAIDAPLVVSPERQAERLIGRAFGKYRASAHSANADLLRRNGMVAGPDLASSLADRGFLLDPGPLLDCEPASTVIEVYPHAAHVRLFDLDERIPYKVKTGRRVAYRREQLQVYQSHLRVLLSAHWPAILGLSEVSGLLDPKATAAKGRALKQLEDMLDAVTCTYIARHAFQHGADGIEMFGDFRTGAVAVPR
jgi:predicted RNase H-like nuclease